MDNQLDGEMIGAAVTAYLDNLGLTWGEVNPCGALPYDIIEWLCSLRLGEVADD